MSSKEGELIVGLMLVVVSGICIFGHRALIVNHIQWNEKMLARLHEDASLDQFGGVGFGILGIGLAILVGLPDKADEKPHRLWIALPIGAFGIACFVAARYLVPIQIAHVRWMHRPLARQIAGVLMILLGGISGYGAFFLLSETLPVLFKK